LEKKINVFLFTVVTLTKDHVAGFARF